MMTYSILWVDDKISDFEELEIISDIRNYIDSFALSSNILTYDNIVDAKRSISENKFDLVVTDYNINNDIKGSQLIFDIRKREYLTEVLLYSAALPEYLDNTKKGDLLLDRVTYVMLGSDGYEILPRKIKALIDVSLKRYCDLTTLRGLVMAETSSLDSDVTQMLKMYYERIPDSEKETMMNSIDQRIRNSIKQNFMKCSVCASEGPVFKLSDISFNDLLTRPIFDAYKKAYILDKMLCSKFKDKENIVSFFKKYCTEIIDVRNKLAHVCSRMVSGVEVLEILNRRTGESENIYFDAEKCIDIRKNIMEFNELFAGIKKMIIDEM